VPLLVAGARVRPTVGGDRSAFAVLGATVGEWLGVCFRGRGTSFLSELLA
jgi:phosphopentomutase